MKKLLFLTIGILSFYLLFKVVPITVQATFAYKEWGKWSDWGEWSDCGLLENKNKEEKSCGEFEGKQYRVRNRVCQNQWGRGRNECFYIGQTEKEKEYKKCEITIPCPTVTPTPEPTVISQSTLDSSSCNGCGHVPTAPQCPNSNTTVAAYNFHILRKESVALAKWVPTAGDQVNIYFKEVDSPIWQFSVRDELNDGYVEINNLKPAKGYVFGLQQKQGCGGGETVIAVVKDPPAIYWKMFLVEEYLLLK